MIDLGGLGFDILLGPGPRTFVVGLEDQDDGALKVYIGHRSKGIYVIIGDKDAQEQIRRAWADPGCHVLIPMPPADAIHGGKKEP